MENFPQFDWSAKVVLDVDWKVRRLRRSQTDQSPEVSEDIRLSDGNLKAKCRDQQVVQHLVAGLTQPGVDTVRQLQPRPGRRGQSERSQPSEGEGREEMSKPQRTLLPATAL